MAVWDTTTQYFPQQILKKTMFMYNYEFKFMFVIRMLNYEVYVLFKVLCLKKMYEILYTRDYVCINVRL